MKAVIFSGSQKDSKNSDSKAWSDLMQARLQGEGIDAEVINLKDFDYEASTEGDVLLPEIRKIYDAELILFAGPVLHCIIAFPLYNLWHRFKHAYKRGMAQGIDIFENKYFDFCLLFGSQKDYVGQPKRIHKNDFDKRHGISHEIHTEKMHSPYPARQHHIVYEKLDFIKNLGHDTLALCLKSPMDPDGPTREEMVNDAKVNNDITETIERAKRVCTSDGRPDCTIEQFTEFFNDSDGKFGRGMTVSRENLNEQTVTESIKRVRENTDLETISKAQIMLCMKERASAADQHDLATMYYAELFRYTDEEGFRTNKCGIHRPCNY